MRTLSIATVGLAVVLCAALQDTRVIREEQTLTVGAAKERWRLVWRTQPTSVCGPEDDGWATCPCRGFAFGEQGILDLVRAVPGSPDDTLHLTPLFADGDGPGQQHAALRRWPVLDADYNAILDPPPRFAEQVRARAPVTAMVFGDFDHDGRATEFMLQTGAVACGGGTLEAVVVGTSITNPRLHAFTSMAHPNRPLILGPSDWQALLGSRSPVTVTDIVCGDHGADEWWDMRLEAARGRIEVTRLEYACTADGQRGPLRRTEAW